MRNPHYIRKLILVFALLPSAVLGAPHLDLPSKYTELNEYVLPAPSQGEVNTCLFMSATGAMEILLNKKAKNKRPRSFGDTDLSERYVISEKESARSKTWFEDAFLKFDSGVAVLRRDMPFESYTENGDSNEAVWDKPENFETAPRIRLPKIDTVFLFAEGNRYSKGVLDAHHVLLVKEALVKYQSPIIAVGNDDDFWHVTVITGYDDRIQGTCHELDSKVCAGKKGAFYVRDSMGNGLEVRSYEWFIRRGNAAAVAKLAE